MGGWAPKVKQMRQRLEPRAEWHHAKVELVGVSPNVVHEVDKIRERDQSEHEPWDHPQCAHNIYM